jgi:hypothetical protein
MCGSELFHLTFRVPISHAFGRFLIKALQLLQYFSVAPSNRRRYHQLEYHGINAVTVAARAPRGSKILERFLGANQMITVHELIATLKDVDPNAVTFFAESYVDPRGSTYEVDFNHQRELRCTDGWRPLASLVISMTGEAKSHLSRSAELKLAQQGDWGNLTPAI